MEHNQNQSSIISKIFKYLGISSVLLLIATLCTDFGDKFHDYIPFTNDYSIGFKQPETLGRI